ncbi:hypothetical protein EST38_g11836 [Candolleomyces aberdarensis]|uniref:Uncharacterized protein n=1 Tax=Candolleomyces aberdarensis TaxID=2316362 RepID=A0A4Q2D3X8_9AGAR|nr:hypothetical protein EST38_g11836 [Candolleomyces aberdarensis]
MSSIEVYSPLDANLHLTLPHDHANSLYSTSPFAYRLDNEFDFVEISPMEKGGPCLFALDDHLVSSIIWAATRTKQIINRATKGVVPAVGVQAPIPDYMFDNLGMKKPRLVSLLERTSINPLKNIGDQFILTRLFHGLQQVGREAIDWIVEARWRSQLMGKRSLWDWEDPRILKPLGRMVGDPRLAHAAITGPQDAPSSPADSTTVVPPNSPASIASPVLPFSAMPQTDYEKAEDNVNMFLQLVLHPTASRYALHYPLIDVFDGSPHVNNGYISEDEGDRMEVDED